MSVIEYVVIGLFSCTRCKGTGSVVYEVVEVVERRCPICKGAGTVQRNTDLVAALRDLKEKGKLP